MRVLITGNYMRAGQEGNIKRLAGWVRPYIPAEVKSVAPSVSWLRWPLGDPHAAAALAAYHLVIGFELPEWAKQNAAQWIDVRMHPIRFLPVELWSVTSSIEGVGRVAEAHAVSVAMQAPARGPTGEVAFTCQVVSDAALLDRGRLVQPADVMDGIVAFARHSRVMYVVQHPAERSTLWPDAIRSAVPNSAVAWAGAYEVLARCDAVCTVSSSTGVEAPYFGARTHWLLGPPDVSEPIAELDGSFWEAVSAEVAA